MPQETLLLPPPLPYDAVRAEVSAAGITPEDVVPGQPVTIGADQPDIMGLGESPYGAGTKVRGVVEFGDESFDVVDITGVTPMLRVGAGGPAVRRISGVTIGDPSVTHLLAGKTFGDTDSAARGYKGLRPGAPFLVSRSNPTVEKRFGEVPSISYEKHGEISVDAEGNVTVRDQGSRYGTKVLTQKQPSEQAAPAPQASGTTDPVNAQAARFEREQVTKGRGGIAGRVGRALIGQRDGVIRVDSYGKARRVRR